MRALKKKKIASSGASFSTMHPLALPPSLSLQSLIGGPSGGEEGKGLSGFLGGK